MSSMNWEQWNQELFEVIERCRNAGKRTTSRAGSVFISTPCDRESKAASVTGINKAKVIADFLFAKRY